MASPTFVLNEEILLNDVYSRIENLCNQVERNAVKKPSIIAMMKRYLLRTVTYADGILGMDYNTYTDLDIVGSDATERTVSLADLAVTTVGKILKIHDVIEPIAASIVAGEEGIYQREDDYAAFMRLRKNVELNALTRHYYYVGGKKQLDLWIGSGITYTGTDPQVRLVFQRQPWIAFTAADVEADDAYIDCPSIYVPYMEVGCAMECLKEEGVKDNKLASLNDEMQRTVTGLNDYLMNNQQLADRQNKDR
jgi:hypothetical protein